MRKVSRSMRLFFAAAAILAMALGVLSIFTEAEAAGCICPLIYAPVQCDKGKIYSNQCIANCRHAKNCVPIGGPIP